MLRPLDTVSQFAPTHINKSIYNTYWCQAPSPILLLLLIILLLQAHLEHAIAYNKTTCFRTPLPLRYLHAFFATCFEIAMEFHNLGLFLAVPSSCRKGNSQNSFKTKAGMNTGKGLSTRVSPLMEAGISKIVVSEENLLEARNNC